MGLRYCNSSSLSCVIVGRWKESVCDNGYTAEWNRKVKLRRGGVAEGEGGMLRNGEHERKNNVISCVIQVLQDIICNTRAVLIITSII